MVVRHLTSRADIPTLAARPWCSKLPEGREKTHQGVLLGSPFESAALGGRNGGMSCEDTESHDAADRNLPSGDEAGTPPGDRKFRPDVEGLRAIAVVLVVLFHAGVPGFTGGFVGVDVFFVISGFVITGVLLRERSGSGRNSILAFYGRRSRRIIPAATLVIITTVLASYHWLGFIYGGNDARMAELQLPSGSTSTSSPQGRTTGPRSCLRRRSRTSGRFGRGAVLRRVPGSLHRRGSVRHRRSIIATGSASSSAQQSSPPSGGGRADFI